MKIFKRLTVPEFDDEGETIKCIPRRDFNYSCTRLPQLYGISETGPNVVAEADYDQIAYGNSVSKIHSVIPCLSTEEWYKARESNMSYIAGAYGNTYATGFTRECKSKEEMDFFLDNLNELEMMDGRPPGLEVFKYRPVVFADMIKMRSNFCMEKVSIQGDYFVLDGPMQTRRVQASQDMFAEMHKWIVLNKRVFGCVPHVVRINDSKFGLEMSGSLMSEIREYFDVCPDLQVFVSPEGDVEIIDVEGVSSEEIDFSIEKLEADFSCVSIKDQKPIPDTFDIEHIIQGKLKKEEIRSDKSEGKWSMSYSPPISRNRRRRRNQSKRRKRRRKAGFECARLGSGL